MRRSSLLMSLAVILTLALSIGGTLAFLTDTDSQVNTFTMGNVDITLNEIYNQGSVLMPGVSVSKTATISNDGKNEAYVFMTVAVPAILDANGNSQIVVEPEINLSGWTAQTAQGITLEGKYYVLTPYVYDSVLNPRATTTQLLSSITLDSRVDFDPNTNEYKLIDKGTEYTISYDLTAGAVYVNAFAIQTTGFADAQAAYDAYLSQWTDTGVWGEDQIIIDTPDVNPDQNPPQQGGITTAAELAELLNTYTASGAGNAVVNLTNDIHVTDDWTPVVVHGYTGAGVITINGNGHKITGLTAPLFEGGFAGASGIVINDLTIADSKIVSTNTLGSGAFIETVDSMQAIQLNNCHLKNSTLSGSRTGGLIGWNSGYNNTNDGAVDTVVTIKNCSVEDCEITGAGTVGGIVGHAGANAWTTNSILNCKVVNTKLTSNDDSYRVGAIVGTANVGDVVITNCTSTGNTILQNNNGTEIARPAGQSELYGRFVPQNGSGTLTIDGVAIQ